MVVGFVGQRWGGVSREEDFSTIQKWIEGEFRERGVDFLYASTGVGVDLAAMAAAQSMGIPYIVVEPFPKHTYTWPLYWATRYARLAEGAQDRIAVAHEYYPGVFDARARRVAQEALQGGGEVWAWWDGYGDAGVTRVIGYAPTVYNLGYKWANV